MKRKVRRKNEFLVLLRSLLPPKLQLKIEYRIKCGKKLNLKNPKTFTEKMQLYKYKYRNPLMVKCADKAEVINYVKDKGLKHIIVPKYGIYDNVDDINFEKLPTSFAIKLNNGSGYNLLVENKNSLDLQTTKKTLEQWLKTNKRRYGTEWVYKEIKPKIIFEKLLPFNETGDLPDFKFFCFNGKVEFLYVMIDYTKDQSKGKLNFYDKKFKKLPFGRRDFPQFDDKGLKKPQNFELMVEYAEILSEDFPHVRVDFYNISGKIYFGELTFFSIGGYIKFDPPEYDFILGEKFEINWK